MIITKTRRNTAVVGQELPCDTACSCDSWCTWWRWNEAGLRRPCSDIVLGTDTRGRRMYECSSARRRYTYDTSSYQGSLPLWTHTHTRSRTLNRTLHSIENEMPDERHNSIFSYKLCSGFILFYLFIKLIMSEDVQQNNSANIQQCGP